MLKRLTITVLAILTIGLLPHLARAGGDKDLSLVPTHGELADKKIYSNSYALLVGINHYEHLPTPIQLHYAVADAISMRDVLIQYYGFPPDHIKMLLNDDATKENVEDALADFADQTKYQTDDRVLVFFSGHGQTVSLPGGGEMGFLIPSDANVELDHIDNAMPYLRSCVEMSEVWDYLQSTPAKHVLLIADACYSGILAQTRALGIAPGALAAMASRRALQVITAGAKGETSTELDEYGHGAFTYKLLEELKARAAEGPGNVFTTSDLYASVERDVADLTNGGQDPQFGNYKTEGDFLFITTSQQKVPQFAQTTEDAPPAPQPQPETDHEDVNPPAPTPPAPVPVHHTPKTSTSTASHHRAYNPAALTRLYNVIQSGGPPPYDPAKEAQVTSDAKAALDDGADPNGMVDEGSGPEPVIIAAASYDCLPAIKLLVQYGAKVNVKRPSDGVSILSLSGNQEIDEYLSAHGAQP